MIQFLADSIDQLDLALDQLAMRDRNFDRFALMLTDNVVELILHNNAQDKFQANGLWGRFAGQKFDQKLVQKALGPKFDEKLQGAVELGLIDEAVRISVQNLHAFRNKAYHQGMRHEGILHALAIFYLRTACMIGARLTPGNWYSSSSDRISHRAMKYLGKASFGDWQAFPAAFNRLDVVAASLEENLIGDLADDMLEVIDVADTQIQDLVDNLERDLTRDQVVWDVQTWPFGFTEKAQKFAKERNFEAATPEAFFEWIRVNYKPDIPVDPIPSWRQRQKTLSAEKDKHTALNKYCQFIRQTEEFRGYLGDASFQLETHIQQQIDASRGEAHGF